MNTHEQSLPKCLIVDDLPDNLVALVGLLENEKIEIHTARSGTEALELLLKHEYALALLDVQMPVMDGFELAEIMRSTVKTKAIPIIFVTAADHDVKRLFKGYEAGAVDFLFKPLFPQVVLGKVRVFIELHNQRIHIEETYRRAKEELESKVQERTRELISAQKEIEAFSYSVSHDLRAPLRSMNGFSKALLTMYENQLDERAKDYLTRINESAQKMGELIDGMLVLSNLGRQEIRREKINLGQMARNILTELKCEDPKAVFEIADDLTTYADPSLIYALMENLLQNAIKYSSKVEHPVISVSSEIIENQKVFYVRDNGAGFDMKYANKLFGAFQRLHALDEYSGMGIGLATAKRIVDRHGGKIWAQAEVGKGATFYFYLPNGSL